MSSTTTLLNPSVDFGHVRISKTELKSTLLVEDYLEQHPDVFAVGVVCRTESDQSFFSKFIKSSEPSITKSNDFVTPNGDLAHNLVITIPSVTDIHKSFDESRILWSQCCHIDTIRNECGKGEHCGDCTDQPVSCQRCIAEDLVMEGLETIKEFQVLKVTDIIMILAILLCAENDVEKYYELHRMLWQSKDENEKAFLRNQIDSIGSFSNTRTRYDKWLSLSEQEKNNLLERARKIRGYFDVRPVVDGIPWW